jgi:hypothetical protein
LSKDFGVWVMSVLLLMAGREQEPCQAGPIAKNNL